MEKVAENIKKLRKQHRLSQQELADRLFVSHQTISGWESGRTDPDVDSLQKLADIFGVSVEYLITGKELVKEVVVEKEVVKEVVKEVPVEKVVEKEVPPDDYDMLRKDMDIRLGWSYIVTTLCCVLFLILLILFLVLLPIEVVWPYELLFATVIVIMPILEIRAIRKYKNPNFLKRKNKKGDKNHEQKN